MGLFNKLFGTRSEREIKKFTSQVDAIEAMAPQFAALTDEERAELEEMRAHPYEIYNVPIEGTGGEDGDSGANALPDDLGGAGEAGEGD